MVKIVYLVRKTSGGMQSHLIGLLSKLDRHQYSPFVVSPTVPKLFEFLKEHDIDFCEIDMKDGISLKTDLSTACLVAELIRNINPDIIHVHGNKAAFIVWLARHCNLKSALKPRSNKSYKLKGSKPKSILTVHNYPSNLGNSIKDRLFIKRLNKLVFKSMDQIIAVSEDIQQCLEQEIGIDAKKVKCVYNGIDIDRWEAKTAGSFEENPIDLRSEHGLPADSILIGTAGRLVPFKAQDVLIKSIVHVRKATPNVYLFILGDGPNKTYLEELVLDLGLKECVKFLGFVDRPNRYLTNLDLFAFPSTREPFGIALLEAAALELPIVAVKAGGVPEIIEDGVNGLLAEPGDELSLAHCIERVISNSELSQRIATNGKQCLHQRFSLETMMDKTTEVYTSCLNNA